jgi:hypothetical protein
MELKCLPKPGEERLKVWRNTLQLFHKTNKYTGPFYRADYKKYQIEPKILMKGGTNEKTPDLVSSNADFWIIVEMTYSEYSKEETLSKYSNLDGRFLSNYGLITHSSLPILICSRTKEADDGHFTQLLVRDKLEIIHLDLITDQNLRECLKADIGYDLSKGQQIPITLLPEMNSDAEIRQGLLPGVIQLFMPESMGKDATMLCDEGLDKLSDVVELSEKKELIIRIERNMNILIKDFLNNYLVFRDGKYQMNKRMKINTNSMKAINEKLQEWIKPTTQVTLDYNKWI